MKFLALTVALLMSFSSFAQMASLIPFTKANKWGYSDSSQNIVIPCQYQEAFPFFEDRALVSYFKQNIQSEYPDLVFAFIDPTGRIVFELNSAPMAFPASRFHNGMALIEKYQDMNYETPSSISVVDLDGNVMQKIDSVSFHFDLELFNLYGKPFNEDGVYVAETEYWPSSVLIYADGRKPKKVPFQVDKFKNGLSICTADIEEGADYYPNSLINTDGELLFPIGKFNLQYSSDGRQSDNGLFPFLQDGLFGYVNSKGEVQIKPKFDFANAFSEGLAVVGKQIDYDAEYDQYIYSYGYIDEKGNLVLDYQYQDAHAFSEGLAEVSTLSKLLFIDKAGNTQLSFDRPLIDFQHSPYYYEHGFKNGRAIMYLSDRGLFGWIDRKGDFIIPPLYAGLFRIGPSMMLDEIENGIVRVSNIEHSFMECYIDLKGQIYMEPSAMLLPKNKFPIPIYPAPNHRLDPIDSIIYPYMIPIKNKLGKKAKLHGKKGEWVEIEHWEEDSRYVFTGYFNDQCYYTNTLLGAPLYKNPNESEKPIISVPPKTILFLAKGQKPAYVGKNKWLKVRYYGLMDMDQELDVHSLYIKGNQLSALPKN